MRMGFFQTALPVREQAAPFSQMNDVESKPLSTVARTVVGDLPGQSRSRTDRLR